MDGNYPYGYGPGGNGPMNEPFPGPNGPGYGPNGPGYGPDMGFNNQVPPMPNQGFDPGFNGGMGYNDFQNGPAGNMGMGYDPMGGAPVPGPDYGYNPMGGMPMNNIPAPMPQSNYAASYPVNSVYSRPEAMPVKGLDSPIVAVIGVMSSLALLLSFIGTIIMLSRPHYYSDGSIIMQLFVVFSFLPIVLESWITFGSAKKREIAATGGLTVGVVSGVIHVVISFVVATLLIIGTIASLAGGYFLQELFWYFGVDIDALPALAAFLIIGWAFMILWIILRFKLNSVRIRFVRRLKGVRTQWPSTMFPAVLMIIYGIFIFIYSILRLLAVTGSFLLVSGYGLFGEMIGVGVLNFFATLLTAIIYFVTAALLIKLRHEQ